MLHKRKFSVDINGQLHYGVLSFMLAVANLAPWFLVVFSKTIHCGLNLTIDLENSGKTTLEKVQELCFYHNLKLRYGSLKLTLLWCQIW